MTKGQIVTPGMYTAGTVSLVLGSTTITGTGTAWTSALIGQSLRVGYNNPIYNIVAVDQTTQTATLELPWGSPTINNIGYFITQYYYSIPNIKYIYSAKNLQLQYRLYTQVPQSLLENIDPSRLQLIYPKVIASMPPDTNGNWQCELWPASTVQQAIPYLAYVQPPNLVNDSDSLPPFMRCDIIKAHAISDVLRYRTKDNPFYSEAIALQISAEKMQEFEKEALQLEWADEQLFRQDIVTWAEQFPYADMGQYGGAMYASMTAQGPNGSSGGGGGFWGGFE